MKRLQDLFKHGSGPNEVTVQNTNISNERMSMNTVKTTEKFGVFVAFAIQPLVVSRKHHLQSGHRLKHKGDGGAQRKGFYMLAVESFVSFVFHALQERAQA
jgi:hypothetical protein